MKTSQQHYFDVQIFNLNISQINLPKVTNQQVIDSYDTAFSFELGDISGSSSDSGSSQAPHFSLHLLIDFFSRNQHFAQHGFYRGFGDLLYNTIISEPRASSEVWMVSVLLKIASLGVTDPVFKSKIDRLIDVNIERYANNALIKLVILVLAQDPTHPKHRDLLMRKLRQFNPENVSDMRLSSQLVLCISQLEQSPEKEQYLRYLNYTMKQSYMFTFQDAHRICRSFKYISTAGASQKQQQETFESNRNHLKSIMERMRILMRECNEFEVLAGSELLCQHFQNFPKDINDEVKELILLSLENIEYNFASKKKSTDENTYYNYSKYQRLFGKLLTTILSKQQPDSNQLEAVLRRLLEQVSGIIAASSRARSES